MKAEERKHLKENELAEKLRRSWQTIASGSATSNVIWGVILVGLALGIGWRYYSDATFRTRSAQWALVEQAFTPEELERIIKENPGTVAGRIATFHLNRFKMEDALAGVAAPSSTDRVKAADSLVDVRTRYSELARESKNEPELVQEAMMGSAKATEVLAAIPKADEPNQPRSTLDEALKGYDELAKLYPDSFLGKQAAKRALELREHGDQVRGFYNGLMEVHGQPPAPPPPPAPPTPPPAGPTLPDAPKASPAPPTEPASPTVVPAPEPDKPKPAPAVPPNPPTAPPAGINPAEGPKPPKDEPKPKAP